MPKNPNIKKVLVIGSGPIVIGQAAEFDYAGTQACRSLKEEGMEVVLLNSNPATIMTDKDIADRVYIEPLTVEVVEQLIQKEKPDSVLPTLGGQAGLNLAMELEEKGFLKENNVRLIGTTAQTIKKAEDRQEFKDTMEKIGEPVAASLVVTTVEDGIAFTNTIGYPVVLRPAYTLGGSGGGIAHNEAELIEILENGLRLSRVGEVLDMAVDLDVVKKGGAWFSYNDMKLGQGRDNAKEFLLNNPDIMGEIEAKIKEHQAELVLAAQKDKKAKKLEEKANAGAAAQSANEDMAADKPEKKIRKAASDKSVVAKPEEDFEEFAPVDISELGD